MTVQRYDPKYHPYSKAMDEDKLAEYVKYSDYEKLKLENKELIEENERMKRAWDDSILLNIQLNSEIKKLQRGDNKLIEFNPYSLKDHK